jgi:hypothetical protein
MSPSEERARFVDVFHGAEPALVDHRYRISTALKNGVCEPAQNKNMVTVDAANL